MAIVRGEFMAGYFDPQDQFLCLRNYEGQYLWQPNANESTCLSPYNWITNGNGSNIIYVDTNPASISPDSYSDVLFTITHEYQHLLHWNSDIKEGYFGSEASGWQFHNPWINEGLSDLMPSILGIGKRDFSTFLESPLVGLDQWSEPGSSSTLKYYAKSALFFSTYTKGMVLK